MLRPDTSCGRSSNNNMSPSESSRKSSRSLSTSINTPEINKNELVLEQYILGHGTFGLVRRGKYNGMTVAVKEILSRAEIDTFTKEVETLSRVSHPNIVKLYGASTLEPCCLVMEYADGGSLHNVIHSPRDQRIVDYTLAHSLSWCHQIADGVAYLHSLKLIHRDLKSPNLLLVDQGLNIKICDFGTACDVKTHMTSAQGSAAWMAPEVFTTNYYTEKCDVHSFGIILWEVLSRKKPFADIDGPSYAIMWAVKDGKRPPLMANCPKPIENLMVSCWDPEPSLRPTMAKVKEIMKKLLSIFLGDGMILAPVLPSEEDLTEGEIFLSNGAQTVQEAVVSTEPVFSSDNSSDLYNFLNHSRLFVPFSEPRNVSRENLLDESLYRRKSVNEPKTPTAAAATSHHRRSGSFEDQSPTAPSSPRRGSGQQGNDRVDGTTQSLLKSRSFDDNSSFDSDLQSPLRIDVSPAGAPSNPFPPPSRPTNFGVGSHRPVERLSQQFGNFESRFYNQQSSFQQQITSSNFNRQQSTGQLQRPVGDDNRNFWPNDASNSFMVSRSVSPSSRTFTPGAARGAAGGGATTPLSPDHPSIPDFKDPNLNIVFCCEPNLRPLQPDPNSEESLNIYRRHVQEINRYLKSKAEASLLLEREKELKKLGAIMRGQEMQINECPDVDQEFEATLKDYEELKKFKSNLEMQVKKIELKKQQEEADRDGFVLISHNNTINNNN